VPVSSYHNNDDPISTSVSRGPILTDVMEASGCVSNAGVGSNETGNSSVETSVVDHSTGNNNIASMLVPAPTSVSEPVTDLANAAILLHSAATESNTALDTK